MEKRFTKTVSEKVVYEPSAKLMRVREVERFLIDVFSDVKSELDSEYKKTGKITSSEDLLNGSDKKYIIRMDHNENPGFEKFTEKSYEGMIDYYSGKTSTVKSIYGRWSTGPGFEPFKIVKFEESCKDCRLRLVNYRDD